ncbi:hypothetical protein Tco_0411732 [Tanacetum coccineum]
MERDCQHGLYKAAGESRVDEMIFDRMMSDFARRRYGSKPGCGGFIFKIENKSTKKGSAMYYPRFTKIVVNYVMEKDPSIPRRNKVNWHYARDDPMFTTINVISRNEATQLYGAILPVAF